MSQRHSYGDKSCPCLKALSLASYRDEGQGVDLQTLKKKKNTAVKYIFPPRKQKMFMRVYVCVFRCVYLCICFYVYLHLCVNATVLYMCICVSKSCEHVCVCVCVCV